MRHAAVISSDECPFIQLLVAIFHHLPHPADVDQPSNPEQTESAEVQQTPARPT